MFSDAPLLDPMVLISDSGCTEHMVDHRNISLVHNIKPYSGQVEGAGQHRLDYVGRGLSKNGKRKTARRSRCSLRVPGQDSQKPGIQPLVDGQRR